MLALVGGLATLFRALAALWRATASRSPWSSCAALPFGVADFAVNANKATPACGWADRRRRRRPTTGRPHRRGHGARLARQRDHLRERRSGGAHRRRDGRRQRRGAAEQLALEEARQQAAWTPDAASLEARSFDELAAEALAVGREDGGILARLAALRRNAS
ncbi:MAG: hypothetical protein ACLTMP_10665 [Eggerthella lenta]